MKEKRYWIKNFQLKRIFLLALVLALSFVLLLYYLGGYDSSKPNYQAESFTKDGFIFYQDFQGDMLKDAPQLLFENEDLSFWFNYQTTTFHITEKVSGVTWYSNPPFSDDFNPAKKLEENQKSTLHLYYIANMGVTRLYNSFTYSVSKENTDKEALTPNFAIKINQAEKLLQVLYVLETRGIDYTYFPYKITKERMEEVIARNKALIDSGELSADMLLTKGEILLLTSEYFELKKEKQDDGSILEYYVRKGATGPEDIKLLVRQRLYLYLYEKCHYTREDAERDNAMFGISIEAKKARFEVAIQYKLLENGLNVKVLANSLQETPDYPIAYIDILPYFTSSHHTEEGYMVIPDGSGAIMNFNNGKTTYPQYSKRIYNRDLSSPQLMKSSETEDVLLPMFAIVNKTKNGGILAHIKQGAAQMRLSADISKRTEAFNKIFFTSYYRESQQVTIGTGWYATEHVKWTKNRINNDIEIDYLMLASHELNYSAIAKRYRNILTGQYNIEPKDTTKATTLNIDLIGVYDFRNHFLGFGYTDYDTMTTFAQIKTIVNAIQALNVKHMNLYLYGWRKKGLINESFQNLDYHKKLGSKAELEELIAFLKAKDIDLYPYLNFGEVNYYQETFGKNHYTVRDVASAYVIKYPYDYATYLYDQSKHPIYPISPKYYEQMMKNVVDAYDFGFNQIALDLLGGKVTGDYEKHDEFFRLSAVDESIKALELASNHLSKMTLFAPNDYAIGYADVALKVPYRSTPYEILDYSIPFYQLVVNGLFDYSGLSINANDEKGINWHIMRILETGSNLSFTFTFDDSSKLIQTDYNHYYYTQYSKWLREVETMVKTLDELGIHDKELISHNLVGNSTFEVVYQNAKERLTIYLNYSEAEVYLSAIKQTLAPLSYLSFKEELI